MIWPIDFKVWFSHNGNLFEVPPEYKPNLGA